MAFGFLSAQHLDTAKVTATAIDYFANSVCHFENAEMDIAAWNAEQARASYSAIGDMAGICEALNYQAEILIEQNKYNQAISLLIRSLEISKKELPQPNAGTGYALSNLGFCYGQQERRAESLALLQESCAIQLELFGEKHVDVARTYFFLSKHHGHLEHYEEEYQYLQKAIGIYEALGESTNMGCSSAYNNLGIWYSGQGDYASAKEAYERTIEIMEQFPNRGDYRFAPVFNNLGNIFLRLGELNKSLVYIQKARILNEKYYPDSEALAINWMNIGNLLWRMGRKMETVKVLEKAIIIEKRAKKDKYPVSGYVHFQLANCLEALGDEDRALEELDLAESLYGLRKTLLENHIGEINLLRGKLAFRRGEDTKAKKYFEQALQQKTAFLGKEHPLIAIFHARAAKALFDKKYYQESIAIAQEGLAKFLPDFSGENEREIPSIGSIYTWKYIRQLSVVKARSFYALGLEEKEAVPLLKTAWENIELTMNITDSMRIHFSDDVSRKYLGSKAFPAYDIGMEICYALYARTAEMQYLNTAISVAERSKAFLLSLAQRKIRIRENGIVADSLLRRARQLQTAIAKYHHGFRGETKDSLTTHTWDSTRFALLLENDALRKQLETRYPEVYLRELQAEEMQANYFQQKLASDELLLEYFAGDSAFFLLEMRKEKVALHRIPRTVALQADLSALQDVLGQAPDPGLEPAAILQAFAEPAQALFKALLAPALETGLPARLLVVPDGPLGQIPFEILLTHVPKAEKAGFNELPYLFRKTQVRYAYAARFLHSKTKEQQAQQQLLAMAPSFSSGRLKATRNKVGALQHTSNEVSSISQRIGGTTFLGQDATETKFKAQASQYRVLHLATHFMRNDSSPLASGILFAQDSNSTEDGILHLYELFDLPLNAELAVLSACNTGSGQLLRGEGQLSLAWGFRMAGCPSLVVSLWNANDQATARLMTEFYKALEDGLNKDAALNQARSHYLEKVDNYRAHPYFWAQFVLLGNADPLQKRETNWLWIALAGLLLTGAIWGWHWKHINRPS
ncbi:MAG TPA: CHAT domain-containing protein [Bacteroidetes bacterium]|nr:CHAT domain-containing protein [Bacteroidota bacterium]